MIRYNMRAIVGGDHAYSISVAQALFESILPHVLAGREVELNFSGIEIVNTEFSATAIGLLLHHVSIEAVAELVTTPNYPPSYSPVYRSWQYSDGALGLSFGVSVDTPNANVGP